MKKLKQRFDSDDISLLSIFIRAVIVSKGNRSSLKKMIKELKKYDSELALSLAEGIDVALDYKPFI